MPEEQALRLELAVEEWVTNVCHHAYSEPGGRIAVSVCEEANKVVVEISDEGRPFDPTALKAPDVSVPLAERVPGGLGVLLIKRMLEEVGYRRDGGRNVVTFSVRRRVRAQS